MKKISSVILCFVLMQSVWADLEEDLNFFDRYLNRYHKQAIVGQTLSYGGAGIALTGIIVASIGVTLNNTNTLDINSSSIYSTSGSVLSGVGIITVLVGIPLWIHAIHEYNRVVDKRNIYIYLTQ